MKKFDYTKIPEKLLTPEIVQMMGCIHEHKGKQEFNLIWRFMLTKNRGYLQYIAKL